MQSSIGRAMLVGADMANTTARKNLEAFLVERVMMRFKMQLNTKVG
jgi:hypothetical protein